MRQKNLSRYVTIKVYCTCTTQREQRCVYSGDEFRYDDGSQFDPLQSRRSSGFAAQLMT